MEESEKSLVRLLDELAVLVSKLPGDLPFVDSPEAPERDFQSTYSLVAQRFPNFGYYNTVSEISQNINSASVVVGDAIDDVTDIFLELREVMWIWERSGSEAALYQFRETYSNHWGSHLRELQCYLLAYSRGV